MIDTLKFLSLSLFLCASASALQSPEQDPGLTPEPSSQEAPEPELQPALMLKLRSGQIRWGHILDHDPDGFRFTLLSHGGVASVVWTALDPSQQQELREELGYVDVATDELMVDVERLILVDGHEVVGVILSREGTDFVVQVDGNLQLVPKRRVQSISKGGQAPALDIYSREELYARHSAELVETDLQGQINMARTCEQFLDFQHALEHFQAAVALDENLEHPELANSVALAQVKAAQQAQIDYLRSVDVLRKKGQYETALERLAGFALVFPASPLVLEVKAKENQIMLARDEEVTDFVRRRWGYWLSRLTRQAAGSLNYVGAVAFAEEGLGEAIREAVLADVQEQYNSEASEDQIVAHWVSRHMLRYNNATYGEGTWMLGEDKALAGTEDTSAQRDAMTDKDKERAALEDKIQRFLKNQRNARRAQAQAAQEDEFQVFWDAFTLSKRANWIKAFYVEFAGDYELRDHPYLKACSTCGGRGALEMIYSGGGGSKQASSVQIVPCHACRGVAVTRRVYYR